jgi:dephospho-CoA kinase
MKHDGGAFLIGLTGNIATGKSEVGRILERLGARVIDADKVAHEVMRPAGPAYGAVLRAFGRRILAADGSVDRSKLGVIVFRDPDALRRLERAVHPATKERVDELVAQATASVVVVEAIKLIEAGMHRRYDQLWVVTAPRPIQIRRLVEQRGMSEAEAALRVDAQPSQQQKAALADRLFVNDGGLDELESDVREAWQEITTG